LVDKVFGFSAGRTQFPLLNRRYFEGQQGRFEPLQQGFLAVPAENQTLLENSPVQFRTFTVGQIPRLPPCGRRVRIPSNETLADLKVRFSHFASAVNRLVTRFRIMSGE
jgi:hypothetical protein